MAVRIREVGPPTGLRRMLFRMPIWLYRAGLGGVLGHRFLLLTHTGRRTGQTRRAVLEVAGRDPATGGYLVASGFGPRTQWLRNVASNPRVAVRVGWRRFAGTARILAPDDSGRAMLDYARRHPLAARELMRLCGYRVDGSPEDYFALGRDQIPFVALVPDRPAT
jgi:deazaflavin-dependent oxidoreductase (nitroreductase family)